MTLKKPLRTYYIWGTVLNDISPLANLTKLENLYLDENNIEDISPWAGLTELDSLDLSRNVNLTKSEIDELIS